MRLKKTGRTPDVTRAYSGRTPGVLRGVILVIFETSEAFREPGGVFRMISGIFPEYTPEDFWNVSGMWTGVFPECEPEDFRNNSGLFNGFWL